MTSVNLPSLQDCHELWTALADRQPFTELEQRYRLTEYDALLQANTLNTLKNRLSEQQQAGSEFSKCFQCQDSMVETDSYYETIIFQDKVIPTRANSWHDLFNGLIWLSFPKTKSLLNQWHVEDIQNHGLMPRTQRRNQITLFDECGVVLAVSKQQLCEQLMRHEWQNVFVRNRHLWLNASANKVVETQRQTQKIKPFVFGHANYEMLMNPFLGLTGKWIAVIVEDDFFNLGYAAQLDKLDSALFESLSTKNCIAATAKLPPLPLLGIPGWFSENENEHFYMNESYFRPLRTSNK